MQKALIVSAHQSLWGTGSKLRRRCRRGPESPKELGLAISALQARLHGTDPRSAMLKLTDRHGLLACMEVHLC